MAAADMRATDTRAADMQGAGAAAGLSRRAAFLGLGAALTSGAAFALTPRRHEALLGQARLDDVIPKTVGPWSDASTEGLVLPDATAPSDFYDQVIARVYAADPASAPVMLLIAYGAAQSGLMKVHRPEVCYTAAGFAILGDHADQVRLTPALTVGARSFLGRREDRGETVLYWTRISDRFPVNQTEQRLVMMQRALQGVIPDGVLVRLSTLEPDPAKARAALGGFAQALFAAAPPLGRQTLAGSSAGSAGPSSSGPSSSGRA